MKKNRFSGFTLVEVLIVTVIMAVISLAIFSTFSNGLKIYNRINTESTQENLVIFCDRLGQELRNCFNYTGIDFSGKNDQLEFASLLNSPRMGRRSVSRVRYVFDPSKEEIDRNSEDYSAAFNQESGTSRKVLDKVASCVFTYYFYDNQTGDYLWTPEWKREGLPMAVRVEMELKDGGAEKFNRTYSIPVGYVVRNETK